MALLGEVKSVGVKQGKTGPKLSITIELNASGETIALGAYVGELVNVSLEPAQGRLEEPEPEGDD